MVPISSLAIATVSVYALRCLWISFLQVATTTRQACSCGVCCLHSRGAMGLFMAILFIDNKCIFLMHSSLPSNLWDTHYVVVHVVILPPTATIIYFSEFSSEKGSKQNVKIMVFELSREKEGLVAVVRCKCFGFHSISNIFLHMLLLL